MSPELRLGDWRDVLADVGCDALVVDPPYGARTHIGQCTDVKDGATRREPSYTSMTHTDVSEFVARWAPRTRGWMAVMSCSDLAPVWREEMEAFDRCTFQPIPCVIKGMTVRLSGDGPSSWAVWLNVSRPATKEWSNWGTLPGAYTGTPGRERGHIGGKPLWLMSAIIRDYTRPGDLVCDPCAGGGTTLQAAAGLGRKAIGAEIDPDTYAKAKQRLERGQMELLVG